MNAEQAISYLAPIAESASLVRYKEALGLAIAALQAQQEREENPGEVSDGYHTFNELYYHRAVLFSVICNQHPERAWKSRKHHDGTMYDGMFIVGIATPEGQATYHYDIDPYWDMFRVPELECAPQWDGHTPAEAIRRIGTLAEAESGWISVEDRLPEERQEVLLIAHGWGGRKVYIGQREHQRAETSWLTGLTSKESDWLIYGWSYLRKPEVTHWMLLPETPKED